jgi:hypothetical protein
MLVGDGFADFMADYSPLEYEKKQRDSRSVLSPERTGIFTASKIHLLMTNGRKSSEMGKTAISYIEEKACETLTGMSTPSFTTAAMQWGIAHEAEAVEKAVSALGMDSCMYSGAGQVFFISPCGKYGGTPDGLLLEGKQTYGIETKCPNSLTHLRYLAIRDNESLRGIAPEYYWQIQCLISVVQLDCWYFVCYDPRFIKPEHQLHCVLIVRDNAAITDMQIRIDAATEMKNLLIKEIENR